MRNTALVLLLVAASGGSAAAQTSRSRWYVGAAGGATNVITDQVNGGAVTPLSGLAGIRVTDTLALELDVGTAIGEQSRERVGWRVSYAGPNATREEIEQMAVTERIRTRSRQTFNGSVMLVWREANPGRVTAALFVGPTWNRYEHVETSEVLRLPPGITAEQFARTRPPARNRPKTLGGLTAGFYVPIVVTADLRVAPEVSYTHGDAGDHHYHLVSARARLLWRW